jgi:hypothetical protein
MYSVRANLRAKLAGWPPHAYVIDGQGILPINITVYEIFHTHSNTLSTQEVEM